ncbi:hypothetical protein CHS0354_005097, partial [Potamilus streckersoni]
MMKLNLNRLFNNRFRRRPFIMKLKGNEYENLMLKCNNMLENLEANKRRSGCGIGSEF